MRTQDWGAIRINERGASRTGKSNVIGSKRYAENVN